MIINSDLDDDLVRFVEAELYEPAIDVINEHAIDDEINKLVDWFYDKYNRSDSKESWIVFLDVIFSTTLKNKEGILEVFKKQLMIDVIQNTRSDLINSFCKKQNIRPYFLKLLFFDIKNTQLLFSMINLENYDNELYKDLIKTSLNTCNPLLLQELIKITKFDFYSILEELGLNPQEKIIVNEFSSIMSDKAFYINSKMLPLINLDMKRDYNDILLILSQYRSRKSYDYNPVLINLNNVDEFTNFLKFFSSAENILEVKFICSGNHCVSGIIKKKSNNEASMWLIDSLGCDIDSLEQGYLIKSFSEVFQTYNIYLPLEKRQNSHKGCFIFALDDLQHLYSLHLINNISIWDYLVESKNSKTVAFKKDENSFKQILVKSCPLPIQFLRTMQSKKLYEEINNRGEAEQSLIINKKGETTYQSSQKFFQLDDLSKQNKRTEHKFNTMIQHTIKYLLENDKKSVENDMKYFTLENFMKRISLGEKNSSIVKNCVK